MKVLDLLGLLLCAVASASTAAAQSGAAPTTSTAAVSAALQRPALLVRHPERAVLLAAAQAGRRIVAVGERGIVVLSDDGGARWRQVPCPVSVTLTGVRFVDERVGVMIGHGGTVLTTGDGGETWALRLDGKRLAALTRSAARSEVEVKSADRLVADGADKPFLDVQMWDAKRILAVGAYGIAFHSDDGGATWAPWMARLGNPAALHWYLLRRRGDTLLLAGEQGLVMRSDDAGASFQPVETPYKGSWFVGELAPGATVLAGLRGNLWRSVDGRTGWSRVATPAPTSITASALAADGSVWLANQGGALMHLPGDTAVPLPAKPLASPSGLLLLDDRRVLVAGFAGVTVMPVGEAVK